MPTSRNPLTGGTTQSNPLTASRGTYNPSTGVYTSPSGQKQSTPSAPKGSTIVGASPIERRYKGGGGGGSGGGVVVQTSTGGVSYPSPQAASQAQQEQQLSLVRQNVQTQRDALQRDTNYALQTKTPYETFKKSGTYVPQEIIKNISSLSQEEAPRKKGYTYSDIQAGIYGTVLSRKESGSLSLGETSDILSKGMIPGTSIPIPGLIQLQGIKLAREQRESEEQLKKQQEEYQKSIEWQTIIASDSGQVYDISKSSQEEFGFAPLNIFKGKSPFKVEKDVYNITYGNVDLEKLQSNLKSRGISLSFDKNVEVTGVENIETPEGIETITSYKTSYGNIGISYPGSDYKQLSVFDKEVKAGLISEGRAITGGILTGSALGIGEGATLVFGFEALGLTGGAKYLSTVLPRASKAGKIFGGTLLGVGAGVQLTGAGIEGYKLSKESGLSTSYGITSRVSSKLAEDVGLLLGGSKFELSPIQVQGIVTSKTTGISSTYSLGIVNPFGRQGFSLATYTKGEGLSLGAFNPLKSASFLTGKELEVGNQLGLQVLRKSVSKTLSSDISKELTPLVERAVKLSYKVTSPEVPTLDIQATKSYKSLSGYPDLQKSFLQFTKDISKSSGKFSFEGLGTSIKESAFGGKFSSKEAKGLERFFGSITTKGEKGIIRSVGDIDLNVYGKVNPKIESFVLGTKAKGIKGSEFLSFKEGKLSFKGTKLIEGFGLDTVQIQANPLGYRSQYPRTMQLASGERVAGQKLGESITQRGSSILTIKGTQKGLVLGPREGQEKAIPDFFKMIGRASELKGGKKGLELKSIQEKFGKIALKINPNIDLESGEIKTISNIIPSSRYSLSSLSFKSLSNLGISSKVSISSKKSLSSLSSLSSMSSLSSLSSKSISSSLSSSSSVSSSLSSLSSLSSSSSKSSSLSSLSSSYIGSSFPVFDFGFPSFGGDIIPTPRKRGRKIKPVEIAPGFTSIIRGLTIKSPLKVSKTFGVTPFQTRGILVGKKRKGTYYTLTDL